MSTTDPPHTPVRARIVTRRRERPFRWGIGLAVGGLLAVIVGGVVLAGGQAIQIAAASDRAEIPQPLVFNAEARTYEIVLLADPARIALPYFPDAVARLRCDVELADGSADRFGGGQTVRVETSFGTSIGSFDAAPGPTTVVCGFPGEPDTSNHFVAVAPRRTVLATGGLALLGVGLAAMGLGVVLIVVGVRGRAVAV